MPHFEARTATGTLAAVNAEVALDLSGDNSATIHLTTGAAFTGTYVIEGSINGTDYSPVLAFPYTPACLNGTIPVAGQPLLLEASTLAIQRALCVAVGQLKKLRVRLSAFTSGTLAVTINADTCDSLSPYVRDQKAATLMFTATGAAAAAVTATIPLVAGLRHYIDRISVVRSATAALTASATPVVVTTTNLPGTPALTFGSDVAGIGVDKEAVFDFGGAGMAAIAAGTNTTIVCPAYTGAIWRVNVSYRLGL